MIFFFIVPSIDGGRGSAECTKHAGNVSELTLESVLLFNLMRREAPPAHPVIGLTSTPFLFTSRGISIIKGALFEEGGWRGDSGRW